MRKLFVALLISLQPVPSKNPVNANIENSNFAFTMTYIMIVSYARSADDKALFELANTDKEDDKDKNELIISTAR